MFKKKEYKVVKLSDGKKWLVIAENKYMDDTYQYLVGVNENEDDLLDEYEVVKVVMEGDRKYLDVVKDQELLKVVIPILMPDTKKYMDKPEKLKELIEQMNK